MTLFQELLSLGILFGVFHGLFLAGVFVFYRRGNRAANRTLALILAILALHLGEILLAINGLAWRFPHLGGSTWPLIYLIGPLFYLYVRRSLGIPAPFRWHTALHAVPALYLLYTVWPWLTLTPSIKAGYMMAHPPWETTEISLSLALVILFHAAQLSVYAALSVRLLRRGERRHRAGSADTATAASLRWLRRMSQGFSLYCGIYFLLLLALLGFGGYGVEIDRIWLLLLSLTIHAIGYAAIQQPDSFSTAGNNPIEDPAPPIDPVPETVARSKVPSPFSLEEVRELRQRLDAAMEEGLYRKEDLRLAELAEHCDLSAHQLSRLLNQELGQSFFDFVNSWRVSACQRLLTDPRHASWSILAIANECGFRNKGTFNRIFRKETGLTPGAYRKSVSASDNGNPITHQP